MKKLLFLIALLGATQAQAGLRAVAIPTAVAPGTDVSNANATATGGSTARTLANRFAEVINVMDYGAKCDGSTDDTTAVNAAIAAVPATGATILFPEGVCVVGTISSLPNNTDISGYGQFVTSIKMKAASNVNGIFKNVSVPGTYVTIHDLSIDGNKANNHSGASNGITLTECSYCRIQNVWVHDVNGNGATLNGNGVPASSRNAWVTNLIVQNNDLGGFITTFGQRGSIINGVYAISNGNGASGYYGIFMDASETNASNLYAYSNCTAGGLTNCYGIYVHNVFGCTYSNLVATLNGHEGIRVLGITSSTGTNWRAQNNGTATSNTYADIYFSADNTGSYGRSNNSVINGVMAGTEAQYGTPAEAYGVYFEDGPYTNMIVDDVTVEGSPLTAAYRFATGGTVGSLMLGNSQSLIESPAPTGVSSSDLLYADSTAHRLKMNNNNGGADTVVGAATTDTLTNKTLTAPAISSGMTVTGNTSIAKNNSTATVEIGDGTTTGAVTLGGGSNQVVMGSVVVLKNYTVATLPACASNTYGFAAVSDATAPTYNGALTGGGTVKVPVFCDGTSWTSH